MANAYVYRLIVGKGKILIETLLKIQCYPNYSGIENWNEMIKGCRKIMLRNMKELKLPHELTSEVLFELLYEENVDEIGLLWMEHWGPQEGLIDLAAIRSRVQVITRELLGEIES